MPAENIDNTINGTGLFPAKVPGLTDAADIQAALRLYHYGSYTYDGSNTLPANLLTPSIAKHLQNLVDADTAEVTNRNAAITTHNAATTNVHGIANTANLATQQFVATAVTTAISGATGGYPALAGDAIDWNSVDARFDVVPQLANVGTIITKTESFTLSPDDVGKTAILYSSNPMVVTLPANAAIEIPVGYSIDIIQTGTGSVTVSEGSGAVSINSKAGIKSLDGQYSKGTLVKIDTNTWFFFGNLLNVVVPTPVPTPVAPVPVPTPVVQPVAPVVQPVAPVVSTPTLATPSLSVSMGPDGFSGGVYANVTVTNYSSDNTYIANSSVALTRNPEFPEEWNISGLTSGQSYTVYITASRNGYTNAQGSITFTANAGATPTPAATPVVTPDQAWYALGCCNGNIVRGSSTVSEANARDNVDEACVGDPTGPSKVIAQYGTGYPGVANNYCDPTPTPAAATTTYWATGCCEGSGGGSQVTGTSTVNSQGAITAMNAQCTQSGYTIPDYSTGSYTTTSNIPTNSCSAATPVPVAPVPVPVAPVAPTPVVVVIPGTIYLSYCDVQNGLVNDTVAINAENFISTNINTACADYTNLLTNTGASSIQCSTVSAPIPSVCGGNPTPVPTPVPVAPVAAQPTPIAPTPVPVVPSTTLWHAVCFSDGGATNDSSTVPNMLYSDCATYRAFVLSIDPGASINCSSSGPVTSPGCTVAPTPAPVVTYSRNEELDIATILCETGRANYTVTYSNANFTGLISQAFVSCIAPTPVPTPVPATPVACTTCNSYIPADQSYETRPNNTCPSGNEYYRICVTPGSCPNITQTNGCVPVTPVPATPVPATPVPATPVPVAVDCTACTGYGSFGPTSEIACADGCGTRTRCNTPATCSNYYLTECPGCGATPVPATPVPATPVPATPVPATPVPAAGCVANCVFDDYVCNGFAATYYYVNQGCGGQAACPPYTDSYGCA